MKPKLGMNNEEGSVLIVALMLLVVVTMIGVFTSTTSQLEIKLGVNERAYKQDLYFADGCALEAAQLLQGTPDLQSNPPGWLHLKEDRGDVELNIHDAGWWDDSNSVETSAMGANANTRYMGLSMGIALGGSISAAASAIHQYRVYGRRERPNGGVCVVEVGFRKVFVSF